jgi:tRNA pseudouridine38-40 synthase
MAERVLQLVLHYDGTDFAGWQVQRAERTVQGVIEAALARLNGLPVRIAGAGRTDAGVHARGQVASARLPLHWTEEKLRRVLNEQLPDDVWVERVHEMQPGFHARYSATGRRYSYAVGLDETAHSPFRRRWGYALPAKDRALDREALDWCAERIVGTHRFLGFAVRGTAPATDDHRCDIRLCRWRETLGGITLDLEANRFLHHMVRFLVGTMLAVASGRRARGEFTQLLDATTNDEVSPPAPPQGLVLEQVTYPHELYLTPTTA